MILCFWRALGRAAITPWVLNNVNLGQRRYIARPVDLVFIGENSIFPQHPRDRHNLTLLAALLNTDNRGAHRLLHSYRQMGRDKVSGETRTAARLLAKARGSDCSLRFVRTA